MKQLPDPREEFGRTPLTFSSASLIRVAFWSLITAFGTTWIDTGVSMIGSSVLVAVVVLKTL